MDNIIKKMINEEFSRQMNERKRYYQTRAIVEKMVRESLTKKLNESQKSKAKEVQYALKDPSINMAGLARKISALPDNDDTRRKEISMISKGEMVPCNDVMNDILHTINTDAE